MVLPPWIIEKIRQREEERRRQEANRPTIRLPLDDDLPFEPPPDEGGDSDKQDDPDDDGRGVIIIKL